MNPEEDERLLHAWSNGETIEVLFDVNPDVWTECVFLEWGDFYTYRIKPPVNYSKEENK